MSVAKRSQESLYEEEENLQVAEEYVPCSNARKNEIEGRFLGD